MPERFRDVAFRFIVWYVGMFFIAFLVGFTHPFKDTATLEYIIVGVTFFPLFVLLFGYLYAGIYKHYIVKK